MIEWIMDQFGYVPCPKCGKYGRSPSPLYKLFACLREGCDAAVSNVNLGMRKYWAQHRGETGQEGTQEPPDSV